ncbi:hypothetical protein FGJ01_17115 [Hydrogenophaga intermedia]|nr:hypothetical protein FGJ01_17115 [Hydrogenophaga intermedia]
MALRRRCARLLESEHPRRASRDPLGGAAPAARQSRFRGALGTILEERVLSRGRHTIPGCSEPAGDRLC